MVPGCIHWSAMVSPKVRVPDPVKQAAEKEADEQDSTLGEVIRGWMRDAQRLRETERSFKK